MNNVLLPLLLISCLTNSSCGCGPNCWGQGCGHNSCGWGGAPSDWWRGGCGPCGGSGGCGGGIRGGRASCYCRPHRGCGWCGW